MRHALVGLRDRALSSAARGINPESHAAMTAMVDKTAMREEFMRDAPKATPAGAA
jgi:hypothetical protein